MTEFKHGLITVDEAEAVLLWARDGIRDDFRSGDLLPWEHNGKEVAGAHLAILDIDGVVLEELTMEEIESLVSDPSFGINFIEVGRAKADLSFRHKKDSHLVADDMPGVLRVGDTFHRGGVYRHGFAVGVSGLPSQWDLAWAEAIAGRLYGIAVSKIRWTKDELKKDFIE